MITSMMRRALLSGDGSTLNLDFTTGVLPSRLTFTRASGGTYLANDGYIYGMDLATSSSLAIGTGSKSVTLTASANVDRRYLVGQTVYISNGANNMSGPVTAYNASTQVLTINATATSGSGSFTSWSVGNASPRFDHDPTTQAPLGLRIEGTSTNLVTNSSSMWNWGTGGVTRAQDTSIADITGQTGTSNITAKVDKASGSGAQFNTLQAAIPSITVPANTIVDVTVSVWIRMNSAGQPKCSLGILDTSGTPSFGATFGTQSPGGQSVSNSSVTMSSSSSADCDYTFGSVTGWVRCSVSRRLNNTTASAINWTTGLVLIYPDRFTTNAATIYVCAAQVETGIGPSSWVPTVASTATRVADTAIIAAGSAFTSWYTGDTSGTFYADWHGGVRSTTGTNRTVFSTSDVVNRHFHMMQTAAAGNLRVSDFGASFSVTTANAMTSGARTKGAFSFNIGSVKLCLNGGTVASGSVVFTTAPTYLVLGGTSTNGTSITDANVLLNGCVRQIKYWPTILPDAQLQSLTT